MNTTTNTVLTALEKITAAGVAGDVLDQDGVDDMLKHGYRVVKCECLKGVK